MEKRILEAERYCEQNGLNFTPVRKKVLQILLERGTAIGAYEILDLLRKSGYKNSLLWHIGPSIFWFRTALHIK